jgi:hypothetical protein
MFFSCVNCGGPVGSTNKSGYCSSKETGCARLASTARQNKYRTSRGPEVYVCFNAEGEIIYVGECTSADRHQRHARADAWFIPEVAAIRWCSAPEDRTARKTLEGQLICKLGHPRYNNRCDRPGGCGWRRNDRPAYNLQLVLPPIIQVNSLDELVSDRKPSVEFS